MYLVAMTTSCARCSVVIKALEYYIWSYNYFRFYHEYLQQMTIILSAFLLFYYLFLMLSNCIVLLNKQMQHFKTNLQSNSTLTFYQNGKDPIISYYIHRADLSDFCVSMLNMVWDSICKGIQGIGSSPSRSLSSTTKFAKRLLWQDLSCSHSRFLRWTTHVILNCLMQWQPFSYRRFYCTNPSRETVEKRIMLIHLYDFFNFAISSLSKAFQSYIQISQNIVC